MADSDDINFQNKNIISVNYFSNKYYGMHTTALSDPGLFYYFA